MVVDTLRAILAHRIMVLDGAMSTMLRQLGPTESGNCDAFVLTRPDDVCDLHRAYLDAGADVVQTNTFASNSIAQARHGLGDRAYELNVQGARLARVAADEWTARTPDRPRFVAGTIGPLNPRLVDRTDGGQATFDRARHAFREQVRGLLEGGADLLIAETLFEPNGTHALVAALADEIDVRGKEVPVMLSATMTTRGGPAIGGQSVAEFLAAVDSLRPFSVGMNCSFGVTGMRPAIDELAAATSAFVSCHPNAGLPDRRGRYYISPGEFSQGVLALASAGLVNIVGGCCGTTPDHIRALAESVRGAKPRAVAG